ncbi:hypothetical protein NDU88_004268 [Pleurodeles waltl]|uniref:Uncharacterized protein n=1 Tax=Pleurodeles waltl TaxID=8319 RepID=A0AAV7QED8_PLEWA|nr:hypothetical protein NDU88_004268 [Pleurodeles waltl]
MNRAPLFVLEEDSDFEHCRIVRLLFCWFWDTLRVLCLFHGNRSLLKMARQEDTRLERVGRTRCSVLLYSDETGEERYRRRRSTWEYNTFQEILLRSGCPEEVEGQSPDETRVDKLAGLTNQ